MYKLTWYGVGRDLTMLLTMSELLRIFWFVCAFSDDVFYYVACLCILKPQTGDSSNNAK